MRVKFGGRVVRLSWVTGALLVVGGGIAYATIPDSGGVIHGCYNKENGRLRVIDTSPGGSQSSQNGDHGQSGNEKTSDLGGCGSNETALNWNQTGPQGPKGDTGATGPAGPQGPPGPGPQPQFVRVDCGAGQSVNLALAQAANNPGPLTIAIRGTCTEEVRIARDDVNLQAASPGAGWPASKPHLTRAAGILLIDQSGLDWAH